MYLWKETEFTGLCTWRWIWYLYATALSSLPGEGQEKNIIYRSLSGFSNSLTRTSFSFGACGTCPFRFLLSLKPGIRIKSSIVLPPTGQPYPANTRSIGVSPDANGIAGFQSGY